VGRIFRDDNSPKTSSTTPKNLHPIKRGPTLQPLSFRVNIKCERGEYQQRKTLAPENGGDPPKVGRIFRDDNSPKTSSSTPKNLLPIKRGPTRQLSRFKLNIEKTGVW